MPTTERLKPGIFDEFMSDADLDDEGIKTARRKIRAAEFSRLAGDTTGEGARLEDSRKKTADYLRSASRRRGAAKEAQKLPDELEGYQRNPLKY